MYTELNAWAYCCEDISKIEGYEKAVSDTTQSYRCHHRLEIHSDYRNTADELKMMGLYYHRPASELIFLPLKEHTRIHSVGRKLSEEHRKKIGEANRKPKSEHMKKALSLAKTGVKRDYYRPHTADERQYMSEVMKGKRHGIKNLKQFRGK